ncbi:MAG: DUF3352 domain-containing protein [Planctomycetes bacterium]|nr:DUF3352 domain-containing protein [Planctomycetota bacterium]
MTNLRISFHCVLGWLLLALATSAACAAESLVALVGSEAGLCLEATGLKRRLLAAAASPLAERLQETGLYREWLAGEDFQKLLRARDELERFTGQGNLERFLGDLFGQSIVVAVYPKGGGDAAGILLVRAADAAVLEETIAAWNQAEQASLQTFSHAGVEFVRRIPSRSPTDRDVPERDVKTQFYLRRGTLLAVSESDDLIRRTIDLSRTDDAAADPAAAASLAQTPRYLRAMDALLLDSTVTLFFNPRAWDRDASRGSEPPADAVLRAWQHCEAVAIGLQLTGGIVAETVFQFRQLDADAPWSRFVSSTRGLPEFLQRVPRQALVVWASRLDLAAGERLLTAQLPDEPRQQWERVKQLSPLLAVDVVNDLLPNLGPNWGLYVVARQAPTLLAPVDGLAAFEFDGSTPAEQRLDASLETALDRAGRIVSQQTGITLEVHSRSSGANVVRWLDGLGEYRPAYCVGGGYVVFASAPDLVEDFLTAPPESRLPHSQEFRRWSSAYFASASQLLFVNVAELHRQLAAHREWLVDAAATTSQTLAAENAGRRLERFHELFGLVDAVFVSVELAPTQVRVVTGGVVGPRPE